MHSYSADLSERKYIPTLLMVAGICTTYLVHYILENKNFLPIPPHFVSIPSAFGFYGIYMWLFQNHLWKHWLFRKLFFLKTPNLNGIWAGYLKSSFDGHSNEYKCKIEISQTWSHINIALKTESSSSRSFSASINFFNANGGTLSYEYTNEPHSSAPIDMNSHLGTARLSFNETGKKLDGYYYSGRGRLRHGELLLKKTKS